MTLEEEIAALKRIAAFHREKSDNHHHYFEEATKQAVQYLSGVQAQQGFATGWYSLDAESQTLQPVMYVYTAATYKAKPYSSKPPWYKKQKRQTERKLCCPRCLLPGYMTIDEFNRVVTIPAHAGCELQGMLTYHECICPGCNRHPVVAVSYDNGAVIVEEHPDTGGGEGGLWTHYCPEVGHLCSHHHP